MAAPCRCAAPESLRPATRETPRAINQQIILGLLRSHQEMSRAELARRLGHAAQRHRPHRRRPDRPGPRVRGPGAHDGARAPARRSSTSTPASAARWRWTCASPGPSSRSPTSWGASSPRWRASRPTSTPGTSWSTWPTRCGGCWRRTPGPAGARAWGSPFPGMLDRSGDVVVQAPALGWRDVALRAPLAASLGLPGGHGERGEGLGAGPGLGAARGLARPATWSSSTCRTASGWASSSAARSSAGATTWPGSSGTCP